MSDISQSQNMPSSQSRPAKIQDVTEKEDGNHEDAFACQNCHYERPAFWARGICFFAGEGKTDLSLRS